MRYTNYLLAALVSGAIAAPAVVRADERPEVLIRNAAQALEQMKAQKIVPPATLARAKCIGVFPGVTEAALVVGGSHGDGVITCKNPDGKFSRVGFVDLTQGSIGAQVGAKRSDIVIAFLNDKSKQALTKSTFTFGADLTATFGKYDAEANLDTAGPDVIAFASDSGLFAGASLNGTKVSVDKDTMKEYYKADSSLASAIEDFKPIDSAPESQLITAITAAKTPQS